MKKKITSITSSETQPFIIGSIIVLIILIVLITLGNFPKKSSISESSYTTPTAPTPLPTIALPKDWQEEPTNDLVFKAVKVTDKRIKPVINVVLDTTDEKNFKIYTNNLMQGARSAFPSLVITRDQIKEQDGFFVRELGGYYYNGPDMIALKIYIYIKNKTVYTVTASRDYRDSSVMQEIDSIITSVYNSIINT